MQHPDYTAISKGGRPEVWLCDSQRKIKYPPVSKTHPSGDASLWTVDILRSSHLTYPAFLSAETIINFAENGVKPETITRLIQLDLDERVDGLTKWDGPDGLFRLWHNTAKEGGVFSARRAREQVAEARARGYVSDDPSIELLDDEDAPVEERLERVLTEQSSAWWWDPISGCPSSLEETSMVLLDSGFSPDSSPILRVKQKEVALKCIKTPLNKYRAAAPMSCSAWAVPGYYVFLVEVSVLALIILFLDPCGVLEEGEIYIESSCTRMIDVEGAETYRVLGDVLVSIYV